MATKIKKGDLIFRIAKSSKEGDFFNEAENGNKSKPLLAVVSLEDLEHLLAWNVSQNHTKRWGCIKGKYSCTYSFMNEDKNEVLKWLLENYR